MYLVRIYALPAILTLAIWALALVLGGFAALAPVIVLTLLEITFSADNAVVNSKVLANMSPFWRQLFMTVGIFVAVFVVRFALPIFIVMLSAGLGFGDVLRLALNDPGKYSQYLGAASPTINAFGGSFLLLIALSYFIDYQKKTHWLGWLERRLGKLGQFDNFTTFVMLVATVILYFTVDASAQTTVLFAAICAMTLYIGLSLLNAVFEKQSRAHRTGLRTGWAAFSAFLYLEVLDASFSLDGVVGAFAITNSVLLIMAGLGAGAVWVRGLTLHLVKSQALSKYIYLEHGAHWAIAFLGLVMWLKLYNLEPPEWIIGSLGLVLISLAILGSRRVRVVSGLS